MKQLLFFLLALLPCLALAQYPSNANQKITLGEQTTADGLLYRGYATTDTVAATSKITRANKQDTSAFLLLDTTTNILWHYKIGSNAWLRVGGSISSGLTGTLPVANGGTNTSTAFTAGSVVFAGSSGTYTQDNANLFFDDSNNRLGIGTANPTAKLDVFSGGGGTAGQLNLGYDGTAFWRIGRLDPSGAGSGNFQFKPNAEASVFDITTAGNVGIGTTPSVQLHTTGGVRFANFGAGTATFDASGNISSSDSRLKKQDFAYKVEGLKEIMKLKPIAFKLLTDINERGNLSETQIGFFADDVAQILPSASFLGNDGYYNYLDRGILAALVKAVQEQQEIIERLKTRILTLENK